MIRRLRAQNGDVGIRVASERACREAAAIGERHANLARAVHHVIVGQDEPVRRDDHAGAGTLGRPSAALAFDADVHDRRRHGLDRADDSVRLAVEHGAITSAGRFWLAGCSFEIREEGEATHDVSLSRASVAADMTA